MSFMSGPSRAITGEDGFAPPSFGGVVAVKFAKIGYTNTSAKLLFTLPPGAEIVGWLTNVNTAFNAGTGNHLDIGDAATANRFADNLSVSSTGQIWTGYDDDELFTSLAAGTNVYATYVPSGTSPTAGEATIACFYIVR